MTTREHNPKPDSLYTAWKTGAALPMEWFINQGAVRTAVITYCNLVDRYKHHREAGKTYTEGIQLTAEELNTSPETVKRAIQEVSITH